MDYACIVSKICSRQLIECEQTLCDDMDDRPRVLVPVEMLHRMTRR